MSVNNPPGAFKSMDQALGLGTAQADEIFLHADWPAPANVRTLISTRRGGVSLPPFDSMNLGAHVGDNMLHVAQNRRRLRNALPAEPAWLNQTHSTTVVAASQVSDSPPDADASFTHSPNSVCVVMTADCLPVLLTDRQGSVVAAAHAGWRGLCHGILENTIEQMAVTPLEIMAWLGPAIGPDAFEVGAEVRAAFIDQLPQAIDAFQPIDNDKYLADIYLLARQRLQHIGVSQIYGGEYCTVLERERFFSYRRDHQTGRMASCIWLDGSN